MGAQCSLCLNEYDDEARVPRILGCGHTYCEKCLARLVDHEDTPKTITCPRCRYVSLLSDGRAKSLLKNYDIISDRKHIVVDKIPLDRVKTRNGKDDDYCYPSLSSLPLLFSPPSSPSASPSSSSSPSSPSSPRSPTSPSSSSSPPPSISDDHFGPPWYEAIPKLLPMMCDECTRPHSEARHRCKTCEVKLCGECVHAHVKRNRNPTNSTWCNVKRASFRVPECGTHHGQACEWWCSRCGEFACKLCKEKEDCDRHTDMPIEHQANAVVSDLKYWPGRLEEAIKQSEETAEKSKELSGLYDSIRETAQDLASSLSSMTRDLPAILQKHSARLKHCSTLYEDLGNKPLPDEAIPGFHWLTNEVQAHQSENKVHVVTVKRVISAYQSLLTSLSAFAEQISQAQLLAEKEVHPIFDDVDDDEWEEEEEEEEEEGEEMDGLEGTDEGSGADEEGSKQEGVRRRDSDCEHGAKRFRPAALPAASSSSPLPPPLPSSSSPLPPSSSCTPFDPSFCPVSSVTPSSSSSSFSDRNSSSSSASSFSRSNQHPVSSSLTSSSSFSSFSSSSAFSVSTASSSSFDPSFSAESLSRAPRSSSTSSLSVSVPSPVR